MLRIMGAWTVDPRNTFKFAAYHTYKTMMTVMAVMGLLSLFANLFVVINDFRKATWNLCITALFFSGLAKSIIAYHWSTLINKIRVGLHRDAMLRNTLEDETIHKQAIREYKVLIVMAYGTFVCFTPVWIISRYFSYLWGPREIPVPLFLPVELDYENEFHYNVVFFSAALGGLCGLLFIIETELAMFTLLIQISRENEKLLKDIPKINKLFEDDNPQMEVNPWLRRKKAKLLLREFSTRQQRIIQYLEGFEISYSLPLLLQMFALSALLVFSAIQCILEAGNISFNLSYQLGYTVIVLINMYLICWYSTRIREQCLKVGDEVYLIHWYRMPVDLRKDVLLMIMSAQRPPRLTAGKMIELNLHAFMLMLRNIYSWLTLFNQLAFK